MTQIFNSVVCITLEIGFIEVKDSEMANEFLTFFFDGLKQTDELSDSPNFPPKIFLSKKDVLTKSE